MCERWQKELSPNAETDTIEAYWQRFLATLPPDSPLRHKTYAAEPFGDLSELADELGALGFFQPHAASYWQRASRGYAPGVRALSGDFQLAAPILMRALHEKWA